MILITLLSPLGVSAVSIDWKGYATINALQNTAKSNFLGVNKREPNFTNFSRVGIQAWADLGNDFHFASQIRGTGASNFDASFDWMLIRWNPLDWLNVLIGKQKYPLFMVSDRLDIGYTYAWLIPPVAVYGAEPLRNFTGALIEANLLRNVSFTNELIFEIYTGNAGISGESQGDVLGSGDLIQIKGRLQYLHGANLTLRNDDFTFRLAYSQLNSQADVIVQSAGTPNPFTLNGVTFQLANVTTSLIPLHGNYRYMSAGFNSNLPKLLAAFEITNTRFDFETSSHSTTVDPVTAYYLTVGPKFDKWTPYYTFSKSDTKSHSTEFELQALGANYLINLNVKAKVEVMRVQSVHGNNPFSGPTNGPQWVLGAGLATVF